MKVTSRDNNGYPLAIASKWGEWELIESQGYDPFTSGFDYAYGNAIGFYSV